MKKSEIKVGGHYLARVSGNLVTIRVDAIRESASYRAGRPHTPTTLYDVTNLKTGRKTTFRSTQKFRGPATVTLTQPVKRSELNKAKLAKAMNKTVVIAEKDRLEDEQRPDPTSNTAVSGCATASPSSPLADLLQRSIDIITLPTPDLLRVRCEDPCQEARKVAHHELVKRGYTSGNQMVEARKAVTA